MAGTVQYRSEAGVASITLDRPDKRNAINSEMAVDLEEAWLRFEAGDDRVAVLSGAGTSFTGGADIRDMPSRGYGYVPGIGVTVTKPVICAVQGWCVGVGIILVMQADLCVAGESARFLYPEAKMGLGRGLVASLAARIPPKVAAELALLAEPMGAARLETHGLVNRVVPDAAVDETAHAMARTLADRESVVNEFYKQTLSSLIPRGPGEIAESTRWRSDQLPGHRPS